MGAKAATVLRSPLAAFDPVANCARDDRRWRGIDVMRGCAAALRTDRLRPVFRRCVRSMNALLDSVRVDDAVLEFLVWSSSA